MGGYGAKEKLSKEGEAAYFERPEIEEGDEEPNANMMGVEHLGKEETKVEREVDVTDDLSYKSMESASKLDATHDFSAPDRGHPRRPRKERVQRTTCQ